MINRRAVCMTLALLASAVVMVSVAVVPSTAQNYPERDVTLVVQSSAGGGSDIFARAIAKYLAELNLLDRKLIVENRPGGSGAIAYSYTAAQAGNPYVLQTIASSFFTTPLLGESPVGPDDFTPVAAIATDPYILVVNAGSSFKTLDDLKKAGSIVTSTTGVVNDQSILSAMLGEQMKLKTRVVPFDGSGEEMSALLGGHVDVMFGNPSEILPQIEAGELRALAVSTKERLESLPDVPTFSEQGYDIVHTQLRAIVMPPDVPQEALAFWQDTFGKLAQSKEWKKGYLDSFNLQQAFIAGDELKAIFARTSADFEAQMRAAGLIK